MLKIFCTTALLLLAATAYAQEAQQVDGRNIPVSEFLDIVRYPRMINCWAKMKGSIIHKSQDGKHKLPIDLRCRFEKKTWRMQVIVADQERWYIRQNLDDGEFGTSKLNQKPAAESAKSLADMMIRPEDITLSFLYWDFQKELEAETVSAIHCRVLELKHARSPERVRVWASTKYFFPVKVQWFKAGSQESFRELQFKDLTRLKMKSDETMEVFLIEEVKISGNGWKTMITFDDKTLAGDLVTAENPPPSDLFIREMKAEESDK